MVEEIDILVKENIKTKKKFQAKKHPENLRHYEKTKCVNGRDRGMRRNQGHRNRKRS